MALSINSYVVQARNNLLLRAFTLCSWCSLLTEKNAIYNLPGCSYSALMQRRIYSRCKRCTTERFFLFGWR